MLRSYHLEMEMASGSYVIAMTGPGDTQEGMDRLVLAVMEIDKQFSWLSPSMEKPISLYFTIFCTIVEVILSPGTIIGIPGG